MNPAIMNSEAAMKSIDFELAREAFAEALKRYPDSHAALVFLWGASGLGISEPSQAATQYAKEVLSHKGDGE